MTTETAPKPSTATDVTGERLSAFVSRIERLEEEKKGIADDIKDLYDELSGTGFDKKIVRQIIKLRKLQADDRREQEELLDTYMRALGMVV